MWNITEKYQQSNLVIESITLLDGVTPDESVQYKLGREVKTVQCPGIGHPALVVYPTNRGWKTYSVTSFEVVDDRVIIKDAQSIYTFKKLVAA